MASGNDHLRPGRYTPVVTKRWVPDWVAPVLSVAGITAVVVGIGFDNPYLILFGGWLIAIAAVL